MVKTLSAYVSEGRRGLSPARPSAVVALFAYKTLADVASKTVTLVVTVAAARALGPADFGVMALGMTTGWLLGVASDAGLPMFAATRVASAHAAGTGVRPIAREVMKWRAWLAAAAALAGGLAGVALVPRAALLPFALIVLHQLFGAMLETLAHMYRGLGRTDVESTISLAHRGTIAVAALAALAFDPTLLTLSMALAFPSLLALVASHYAAGRLLAPGPAFTIRRRDFSAQIAPLGLGVLVSALYFRIDVYILERLHGIEAVGSYNAAFRLVDAVRLLAAAALAVAYPSLCTARTLAPLWRLSTALVAASVPVAGAVFMTASPLLVTLYGSAFASAAPALQALAFSIPLFFLNYALTHQMIAWEQQRAYLTVALAALVTNLVGNALLIPQFAAIGAAWSTLITEVVLCTGCLVVLRRR
jgi:O-antigen/teichoic acid export membrane protein